MKLRNRRARDERHRARADHHLRGHLASGRRAHAVRRFQRHAARCFRHRPRHQGRARGAEGDETSAGQDRCGGGGVGGADELRCVLLCAPHRPLCRSADRRAGAGGAAAVHLGLRGDPAGGRSDRRSASPTRCCASAPNPCRAIRSRPTRIGAASGWARWSSRTSCGRRRWIRRRSRAWATRPRSWPSATRSRARTRMPSPPPASTGRCKAREAGYFKGEVVPVVAEQFEREGYQTREIRLPRGVKALDADDASAADSAGSAQGAQARVQGCADGRQQLGHRRRRGRRRGGATAKITAMRSRSPASSPGATVGVPPEIMGIGPAPAIRAVLDKAGLKLERHRPLRDQRGVRRAVHRRGARAGTRPRQGQRQRRRHRHRPSAGRHGHPLHADGGARAAALQAAATASPRPAPAAARASRSWWRTPMRLDAARVILGSCPGSRRSMRTP